MKLFPWAIKSPDKSSTNELQLQLENAKAALSQAEESAREAETAFDLNATKEGDALKSQDEVKRARLHVDRATRLLRAAEEREAEQARLDLAKRKDELLPKLVDAHHKGRVDLPDATFAAFLKFVEAYAAEFAHERVIHDLERQVARMVSDLEGIPYQEASDRVSQPTGPYFHVIRDRFLNLPPAADGSPMRFARNQIHQEMFAK